MSREIELEEKLDMALSQVELLENRLNEAGPEIDRLANERDEWRKAALEVTRQANETRDRLTEERDIWKADFEKVVGYNTKKQELLEKVEAELEQVKRELEQAIAERTPHDYGILKNQRDDYRDRLCASIKETQEARGELERLKRRSVSAVTLSWNGPALTSGGGGGGPCAGNDHHIPAATKMIRPEPSRLEIAAMVIAARSHSTFFQEPKSEAAAALIAADALIEAAKGGAE